MIPPGIDGALTCIRSRNILLGMIRDEIDLAALRKAKDLSQAQLAESLGVSQATVSRLEKGDYIPSLKIAAKLGRELGIELKDLLTDEAMRRNHEAAESRRFFAFCPDPFCARNEFKKLNGDPVVLWNSGALYDLDEWEDINFCTHCGSELIKECPGCSRHLEKSGARFCVRCGAKINERPTKEELDRITEALDDDIPF
jgi:putative transcriptional regulator